MKRMLKEEAAKIVNKINDDYPGFIKDIDVFTGNWTKGLVDYDYDDVYNKLSYFMSLEQFQYKPPTIDLLLRDIQSNSEKTQSQNFLIECRICGRFCKTQSDYDKHFERCSSIRYLTKQAKRFNLTNPSKKILYDMNQEEFDMLYNKVLRVVQSRTTDELEKERSEFIFNPPSQKEAMSYFDKVKVRGGY